MAESEAMDFEDELRRLWKADPFIPFEIVVTSGDRYQIGESLHLVISRNMITVMSPGGGTRFFRKNQLVAVHVKDAIEQARIE
jgi:hypothetical protein